MRDAYKQNLRTPWLAHSNKPQEGIFCELLYTIDKIKIVRRTPIIRGLGMMGNPLRNLTNLWEVLILQVPELLIHVP